MEKTENQDQCKNLSSKPKMVNRKKEKNENRDISKKNINKNFKEFQVDNFKILLLGKNQYLNLTGSFSFSLVEGHILIDGALITKDEIMEFHFEKFRALTIMAGKDILEFNELIKHLKLYNIIYEDIKFSVCAILRVFILDNYFSRLILSLNLRKPSEMGFHSYIAPVDADIHNFWFKICEEINSSSLKAVFVCGHKQIGKSYFVRLLANISLKMFPLFLFRPRKVFILDTDVDQSLFRNPFQISLYHIQNYIYGQDYSKTLSPIYSIFLGDCNPMFQIMRYLNGIAYLRTLFDELNSNHDSILIINSIGWLKDFGIGYLTDMIRFCKPDTVVHINRNSNEFFYDEKSNQGINSSMENFKHFKFESDFSQTATKIIINQIYALSNSMNNGDNSSNIKSFNNIDENSIKIFNIQSCCLESENDSINPNKLKIVQEMSLFSNLYKCPSILSKKQTSNYIQTLIPIKLKINEIVFSFFGRKIEFEYFESIFLSNIVGFINDPSHDQSKVKILRNSLNLSIKITDHSDFSGCIAIGFIRNIDWKNGYIYIVSPIKINDIPKVNILAIGNATLYQRFLNKNIKFSFNHPDLCKS